MSPLRLTISAGKFRDASNREVVLRGINLGADAKNPSEPPLPSHVPTDFFDGDSVTFHARPFPREEASLHFSRLRRYGFNTLRYVFTWEAVEARGPGRYDEEWIAHTVEVLRVAGRYGFYVFMDPHQDVWSRFTGGSGAPMWTLYAAGLNPQSFLATEASLVHNTYPDPDAMPKMIWATNYFRLAAATMFTLFFAGKDFAPRCVIDGVNIQEYLQGHFARMCAHVARRIHEAGDLEDGVVVGWESMNEPNPCMVGHPDLSVVPEEQPLKKGTTPTAWQTFLLGMGRAVEVETWDVGGMGPYKVGRKLVDPRGEKAWLPEGYDESRYGYKRDPGWRLGECVWAQHGVWDPSSDELLQKEYFKRRPGTGDVIDRAYFADTYFMEYYRGWRDAVRAVHRESILLLQSPTLELPPRIKGTADDDAKMGFAPHWYDGITLMTKHFNRTWNVDVVGILRGRYWHPALAIKIGEAAIRACFRDQMAALRQEGKERVGEHPVVMTEFGIPFDMDGEKAYETGDYGSQTAAMDANFFAVEGSAMEGYCLWVYVAGNDHAHGDQWNGEDLSIVSTDDKPAPAASSLPRDVADRSSPPRGSGTYDLAGETRVTPENLRRTMTNPSITSSSSTTMTTKQQQQPGTATATASGYRAAEAYIRPSPSAVAGDLVSYGFDLRTCTFELKLRAGRRAAGGEDAPTEVFLPALHFPKEQCEVEVSSGKWEIGFEAGEEVQRLRWWHGGAGAGDGDGDGDGAGEEELRVKGVVRNLNMGSGEGVAQDVGYLEQCLQMRDQCLVM